MRRLAVLLALFMAACTEPPPAPPGVPEGPTAYGVSNGALVGCSTWGFETICRRG